MKTGLLAIATLAILVFDAGNSIAQRFTSEASQPSIKPDTGFLNAEKAYLALKDGNLDNARKYLSSADASNPFAMYVRAEFMPDAAQAAGIYKVIANQYPDRSIAHEALLQLYKYHYAAGDYRLAHTDYLQLRKYPGMTRLVDPAGLSDTIQDQAPPPQPQIEETPPSPPPGVSESYSVQLGVFSTQENADRFVAQLKSKGVKAAVSPRAGVSKTLYAVTAGDFRTREAADAFAANLKGRSIDCVVVKTGESRE